MTEALKTYPSKPTSSLLIATPVTCDRVRTFSGVEWCRMFPGSASADDLKEPFRQKFYEFYVALERAGCSISIAATYRPPERAYLMWAAWMIHKKHLDTRDVPEMPGVDIEWNHGEIEVSKAAASAMCRTFGIISLKVAPAITSEHISGFAVDMNISWAGSLSIEDRDGKMITINSGPTDNMNTDLQKVGASFGVHHFFQGALDRPHWSINAR